MTVDKRDVSLDALRGIAILLVLGQHHVWGGTWYGRIGWTGVDLFFVLSGFLVTGLLIKERRERNRVDVGRFLVRRGFKIYPSFWAMIAVTVAIKPVDGRALLCELLFLQSYGPALWVSTWSLAIEEHFYIGIAALFLWLNGRGPLEVRTVVKWAVAGFIAIIIGRCLTLALIPWEYRLTHKGTHVRIDGLMFGALIAYLHYHAPVALSAWVVQRRGLLLGASAVLLTFVALIAKHLLLLRTIGFSLAYVAYAGVLLVTIHSRPMPGARALAWIGRYSYGIYLWHMVVFTLGLRWFGPVMQSVSVYYASTIAVGVVMSRLIEFPVLAVRDRYFPARRQVTTADELASSRPGGSAAVIT